MRILYDSKDPLFKEPFGTLLPGESCRISVQIPVSCKTREAKLVFGHENGEIFAEFPMKMIRSDTDYEVYSVVFSLEKEGLYFYSFRITTEHESFSLYREGFDQTNMEAGELWQLSCLPASFSPPKAYAGKILYQIFPDRFYDAGRILPAQGKLTPYRIHKDKREIPDFEPNEEGEILNCDFYGGNLRGIAEKLDYLASLGVSVLYLNPIFKAYSNHRYDTADYLKIDELLGDEADFSRLCALAHEKGMKIILDGVFSHTGSDSRYFDQKERFGNGAYHHPDSPYRSWYQFEEYPEKYVSWWGIKTLPCVNELDDGYLDFIIRGEDSVVAHWLRAGADGFRLDVADELPDEFIALLRKRLKEINPQALLIGEVWEDASNKISYGQRRRYFTAGELDSVMNYPFRSAILDFVCERDGGLGFRNSIMDLAENYPPQVLHTLMNMLSTHDTPRLLSALSPVPPPERKEDRALWQMDEEARAIAQRRLFCAAFLQFVLPGMPCIYYGDEIGTEGYEDPFCRGYFDWDRVNGENRILAFFRALAALRIREAALRTGALKIESDGAGRVFLYRTLGSETLRAAVNLGEPFAVSPAGTLLFSQNCEEKDGAAVLLKYGFFLEKQNGKDGKRHE